MSTVSKDHVHKFFTAAYSAKSTDELINIVKSWYHPEVQQNEAGQAIRKGLDAVLEHEKGFFGLLQNGHFDKIDIHSVYVDGNRSFTEHTGYATFKGAPGPYPFHQLVEQEWKDGKIIREVFWHEKPEQKQ